MNDIDKSALGLEGLLRFESRAMRLAMWGEGTPGSFHLYNWQDKPHRVVFDAIDLMEKAAAALRTSTPSQDGTAKFRLGDHVEKIKGSRWRGKVVGTYSTSLTPEGYAVESDTEIGSVQIYPAAALALIG